MLYLHCGWPRTSTTSLQIALSRRRERLARAGIVYPRRWISKSGPTHHGVSEMLQEFERSAQALNDLKAFVETCGEQDVLLSAEALSTWLLSTEKQDVFFRFLEAVQEAVPTRCVWTLRRLDEQARSLYLIWTARGKEQAPPDEFFTAIWNLDPLFAGLRRVATTMRDGSVHVPYSRTGDHNGELLNIFGVPEELRSEILDELEGPLRDNASLSHKQTVAVLNLERLCMRAGVQLDAAAMRRSFWSRDFEFDDDRECDLVGIDVRKALHERALASARRQRFFPYLEFFGESEVTGAASVHLGVDVLTDRDLQRLIGHFACAKSSAVTQL